MTRPIKKNTYKISDFIKPICLPEYNQFPNYNFTVGSRLFVAGWGRTETGFASPVKLKLKVPIFNHTECENVYHKYNITITPCQVRNTLYSTECKYGNFINIIVSQFIFEFSVMCWRRARKGFV